jgi:hypothetical protein
MELFEEYSIPGLPHFEIRRTEPAESEESAGYIVQYEGKSLSSPFPTPMEARQFVFHEAKKRLSERRVKFEAVLEKVGIAMESLSGDDIWVLGRYQMFKG